MRRAASPPRRSMSRGAPERSADARPAEWAPGVPGVRGRAGTVRSRSPFRLIWRVRHADREGWLLEGRLAATGRPLVEGARQAGRAAGRMRVALERASSISAHARHPDPLGAAEVVSGLVTRYIQAYAEPVQAWRRAGRPAGPTRHAARPAA